MRRRYIAATIIAAYAAAGLHPSVSVTWQLVALVAIGAGLLIGAHGVDRYKEALEGVSAGAVAVDSEDAHD
jgi:hypothetical protein